MATENKKPHEDLEKAYLEHLYRIIDVDTRAEAFEDPESAIDHTVRDATVMRAFELIQLYKLANTTGDARRALAQGLGDIVRKIR